MGKPDAPQPPNPQATAAAQTGTNVSTAVANSFLGNVNQNTPQGSLRYDVTGTHGWTDPSTGKTYQIPTFTSTQSYSPQQQAIFDQNQAAQMNMAGMANAQSGKIASLLSTPFNPSATAPAAGDASSITNIGKAKTSFDPGGQIQTSFGDAGDITKSYGAGDFSQDRQRVEDSLMERMNPQLARERGNIEQRLADQGIRYGSQAYASAMDDYNRQSNDARFGAISQAGSEQQRMMDMAAQRAGFQNQAQQQTYDQAMGRGSFANQAAGQQFQQNAALGTFENAGLAQQLQQAQAGFNAQNAARSQSMGEQYAQRNQPLNEITALMSGSQVKDPNFNAGGSGAQIPTTDYAGIVNQNFQNQMGIYGQQMQSWNSTMGGLLGLGGKLGGAAIMSDRRVKKDVDRIGTVFAASVDGERKKLPIYEWEYKNGDGQRRVGPMAQDVEKIDKRAVTERGGVKHIYPERVMGSILKAA